VAAAEAGRQLAELAHGLDTTPAALAIAFALINPAVAGVLFGATTAEQVRQNVAALALADRLDDARDSGARSDRCIPGRLID
jgi:L-glyceraldehyde 3-phosphate reductase